MKDWARTKPAGSGGEGPDPEEKLLVAAGEYLRMKGWTVAVIGADRVQQALGSDLNFELVLRFTEAAPEKADA